MIKKEGFLIDSFMDTVEHDFYETLTGIVSLEEYAKQYLANLNADTCSLQEQELVTRIKALLVANRPSPTKYNKRDYNSCVIFDLLKKASYIQIGDYSAWHTYFGSVDLVGWQAAVSGASEYAKLVCDVVDNEMRNIKNLLDHIEGNSEKIFSLMIQDVISKTTNLREKLVKISNLFKQHNEIEKYPELEGYVLHATPFIKQRELGKTCEGIVSTVFYSSSSMKKHDQIYNNIKELRNSIISAISSCLYEIKSRIKEGDISLHPELQTVKEMAETGSNLSYELSDIVQTISRALAPASYAYFNLGDPEKHEEAYNKLWRALEESKQNIASMQEIIQRIQECNIHLPQFYEIIDHFKIEYLKGWGLPADITKTEDLVDLSSLKLWETNLYLEIIQKVIDEIIFSLLALKAEPKRDGVQDNSIKHLKKK